MQATSNQLDTQSVLRGALIARAVELGIDPDTLWCPSPHAIAARRTDGSLLRIDFGEWPGPETARREKGRDLGWSVSR